MHRSQFLLRMAVLCGAMVWFGPSAAVAAAPTTFEVSEFKFQRPARWEWVEANSPMRKAQLKVTDQGGKESGEVVFFFFGGDGGGTEANIQRWLSQFVEARDEKNTKVERKTVGQTKLTYVRAEGTYQSGMPGGPKTPLKDHVLLGAILEGAQGHVFIRYTSPKALAGAADAEFRGMVESALK